MNEFKIRSYGKSELASLYMPTISPKSAWNTFHKKWMSLNPRLYDLLQATGTRRRFTPQEVRIIVEELGEP